MTLDTLILRINAYIINPFIAFLFVVATAYFVWGLVNFFLIGGGGIAPDASGKGGVAAREIGKRHMKWGLVGMFIMITVFGIMRLIVNTFDIDLSQFKTSIPS